MPSNVINLSAELEAREHRRKLTPKQETTIRLRGYYSKQFFSHAALIRLTYTNEI
jgi:hypothetical protein